MSASQPSPTVLEAAARVLGPHCVRDRPLGALTTYRVGGTASIFLQVERMADLDAVHRAAAETQLPVLVIGRGSNLLIADAGFPGIAITLGESFDRIAISTGVEESGSRRVCAGGATYLPVLARQCAAAGVGGMEWAVGIPGSVGGGVCMNAGGHGAEMRDVLVTAEIYDLARGRAYRAGLAELGLGYRESGISGDQVVLEASLDGYAAEAQASRARINEIVRWRREHQPGGANAGSVFVNPDGDTAGRLVEAVGCKGSRLGSAQVSPRHANFIQADQGGSADDVALLIRQVRRRVADETGIMLRLECRVVGEFPLTSTKG